jgi:hypothetical protein
MPLTYSHAAAELQALKCGDRGDSPLIPQFPWVFSEWLSVYPLI